MRRLVTPYRSLFLLTLLLLVGLRPRAAQAQAVPAGQGLVADSTELRVLRQFYYATGGDAWTTRTNWPTHLPWADTLRSAQFATWAGVTVTNGDVTGLTFLINNLVGSLPASLSALAQLTTLDLYGNQGITGVLPASIGQLSNLTDGCLTPLPHTF